MERCSQKAKCKPERGWKVLWRPGGPVGRSLGGRETRRRTGSSAGSRSPLEWLEGEGQERQELGKEDLCEQRCR